MTRNSNILLTIRKKSAIRGFGLLEALIVIAIIGVVTSIALPSFAGFIDQERANAAAEAYAGTVSIARSAAIKSGTPVIICATSNSTSCASKWSDGWLVFQDDDRDNILDATESVLLRHNNDDEVLEASVTSTGGTSLNSINFNHRGAPASAHTLSITRNNKSTTVSVTPFGKARFND